MVQFWTYNSIFNGNQRTLVLGDHSMMYSLDNTHLKIYIYMPETC
jgi:hypothetical protein